MSPQQHTAEAKRIAATIAARVGTQEQPVTVQMTAVDIAALQLTATIGVLHATLGATR